MAAVPNGGLSPRVRGNPKRRADRDTHSGPIPACAGEPYSPCRCPAPPRAYPRVCGGTTLLEAETTSVEGLSPRVRGNRSTPPTSSRCPGLSPRVRGNRHPRLRARPRGGPIPACAGEPRPVPEAAAEAGAYPRVCGGTEAASGGRSRGRGLSPRVRGNQGTEGALRLHGGPIPACAGEPAASGPRYGPSTAYPRVCGGTMRLLVQCQEVLGLSPRVRGNHPEAEAARVEAGPIPACAGEPHGGSPSAVRGRAYPRVCGGTAEIDPARPFQTGLSPRVRGNRDAGAGGGRRGGPIPACAGEPRSGREQCPEPGAYPRVCGGT